MDPLNPSLLDAIGLGGGGAGDPSMGAGAGGGFNAAGFLKALQGVQMPKGPEAQKVTTPHLPTLTPIKGGEFFQLLQALGQPAADMTSRYQLPSTLPAALGRF